MRGITVWGANAVRKDRVHILRPATTAEDYMRSAILTCKTEQFGSKGQRLFEAVEFVFYVLYLTTRLRVPRVDN